MNLDWKATAHRAIQKASALQTLAPFNPQVVSTIMVGLNVADSDIDIICQYEDPDLFRQVFLDTFGDYTSVACELAEDHVLGSFIYWGFKFEIYGSPIPVKQQAAYRHYRIMERAVTLAGDRFQSAVLHMRTTGLKTEPAIARLLGLTGNPYDALLVVEHWDDQLLKAALEHQLDAFLG